MLTERQIQETVATCVALGVYYHSGRRTAKAKALMVTEMRAVARRVRESGLGGKDTDERILRPVEAGLIVRYGPEAGRRLYVEVAEAFEGQPPPISSPVTA